MTTISRRGLTALPFAALAARAYAKSPAPAVSSAFPDAVQTAAMIKAGEVSALDVAQRAIAAAQRLQPQLNFLVASDFDRALDRARAGAPGPFGGVPYLIKDLDDVIGLPTRSGSRVNLGQPPATRQSPLVDAVVRTGANIIGKSATPEYGFLPTTEPTAFGPTRNPWDPSRSSGGSSGGAAVAVAAGVVPFAHASDGGGSIRIPASSCGLFGLKPSRGRMLGARGETRISDIGVEHLVSRSVRDSAVMFAATEDAAPGAAFPPVGLVAAPLKRKLRIGLLIEGGTGKAPDPDVKRATEAAAELLSDLGHQVVPTKWPIGPEFINDFLALWASGAADLAGAIGKALGRPAGPGELEAFTRGMAEMSARAPADALPKALQRLQADVQAYEPWFAGQKLDVILSPVLSTPAPPLGFVGPDVPFDTLVARLIDYVAYTPYHNVAGAPAMSVPLGWSAAGLPIGAMFAARPGQEGLLFQLAYQLELARPWADKAPPIRA